MGNPSPNYLFSLAMRAALCYRESMRDEILTQIDKKHFGHVEVKTSKYLLFTYLNKAMSLWATFNRDRNSTTYYIKHITRNLLAAKVVAEQHKVAINDYVDSALACVVYIKNCSIRGEIGHQKWNDLQKWIDMAIDYAEVSMESPKLAEQLFAEPTYDVPVEQATKADLSAFEKPKTDSERGHVPEGDTVLEKFLGKKGGKNE